METPATDLPPGAPRARPGASCRRLLRGAAVEGDAVRRPPGAPRACAIASDRPAASGAGRGRRSACAKDLRPPCLRTAAGFVGGVQPLVRRAVGSPARAATSRSNQASRSKATTGKSMFPLLLLRAHPGPSATHRAKPLALVSGVLSGLNARPSIRGTPAGGSPVSHTPGCTYALRCDAGACGTRTRQTPDRPARSSLTGAAISRRPRLAPPRPPLRRGLRPTHALSTTPGPRGPVSLHLSRRYAGASVHALSPTPAAIRRDPCCYAPGAWPPLAPRRPARVFPVREPRPPLAASPAPSSPAPRIHPWLLGPGLAGVASTPGRSACRRVSPSTWPISPSSVVEPSKKRFSRAQFETNPESAAPSGFLSAAIFAPPRPRPDTPRNRQTLLGKPTESLAESGPMFRDR